MNWKCVGEMGLLAEPLFDNAHWDLNMTCSCILKVFNCVPQFTVFIRRQHQFIYMSVMWMGTEAV